MVRTFVALGLSPEIQDRLGAAQAILKTCGARLTFVRPGIIHITVKFLGEVEEKELPRVIAALKTVTGAPFPIEAARVTVDNPARPRTVWCTIEDAGRSLELFRKIEDVLEPLGFPRERRRFTPHATVARVRNSDPSLLTALGCLEDTTYGCCTVTGFRLKKSTLTPQGPVYEDLLEVGWP